MPIAKQYDLIILPKRPGIGLKSGWPGKTQSVFMQLVADITLVAQKNDSGKVSKILHVDLANSKVGPGQLLADKNDIRGYFLDYIWVYIWCQANPTPVHIDTHEPDMLLHKEGPTQAPNASGSISSSISIQAQGSVGAFGGMPIGSMGGGGSISRSHAHSMLDFSFKNLSQTGLRHEYFMEQLGDGEPYNQANPKSCLEDTAESWNPLIGMRLRPLPTLAKTNTAVISQVGFVTKPASELNNRRTWLCIQLDARFTYVEGSKGGSWATFLQDRQQRGAQIFHQMPIDLQDVTFPDSDK